MGKGVFEGREVYEKIMGIIVVESPMSVIKASKSDSSRYERGWRAI